MILAREPSISDLEAMCKEYKKNEPNSRCFFQLSMLNVKIRSY